MLVFVSQGYEPVSVFVSQGYECVSQGYETVSVKAMSLC